MNIFPIFAIGLGGVKVPEGLTPARKMFIENKKLLDPMKKNNGHTTTLNGYKRKNFATVHKDTANLKKVMELIYTNAIQFYVGCGYDLTNDDLEISNIWLNEMEPKSTHFQHAHYGFQLSGCFYIDIPENSGSILFSNADRCSVFSPGTIKTYTIFNSSTWTINPEEGDMYFWRSDLFHEVPTADFVGVRRSIAFDISLIDKKQETNKK